MSVVLSILQVIGWILLVVLVLLLVVLLILLFCPFRYLVEGDWQEEKWARFKAHWLFHLLRAKISYGDDLIYGEIAILWKKITFSHDFTKKEEEAEDILDESVEEIQDEVFESEKISNEKVIGTETAEELRGEVIETEEDIHSNLENESDKESDSDVDFENEEDLLEDELLSEEQKESIVSKIKGIIERIKEVYPRIKAILTDEQNQDAVKHIKDEVVYLIKILLPKKSKVNAVFSTGSPDTTGQLFGILALFPAMYHKNWNLVPDFQSDDAYFKGTFWGKGWIAVYQLVGIILRILFDKNCRRLYTNINRFLKWIKKEDKSQEEK